MTHTPAPSVDPVTAEAVEAERARQLAALAAAGWRPTTPRGHPSMSHLRITSTGHPRSTRIELDGVDISDQVCAVSLHQSTTLPLTAMLTMRLSSVDIDAVGGDLAVRYEGMSDVAAEIAAAERFSAEMRRGLR